MKCEHEFRRLLTWSKSGQWHAFFRDDGEPGARICADCGHWLSLGPANDGGEHAEAVKVEKDALINWAPLAPFGIDYDECCCAGCQKRWLADCIAEVA